MDSSKTEETEKTSNESETNKINTETDASSASEKDELNTNAAEAVPSLGTEDGGDESENKDTPDWDDFIDEVALKDLELTLNDEDKERMKNEAEDVKEKGNQQFKLGEFRESAISYTLALRTCPLSYSNERSKLYSNRAASKMKLGLSKSAIEDCNQAVELNPTFMRALLRRAHLLETADKLDEALEDYKKILELDPGHTDANVAVRRLPDLINERNEKLKTEMMSKLKDLGNLFLRPFGLSTDNFQLQDSGSGGYSVQFKQS
ncbi:tetratricopeptide repeat protein 1 [Thrips palmi]|uniref:Tetratricopeptide repeat protein 1 n=1 Tax=Thrips palmi TaxID=161013 RepID=A0A6P9ADZ3_THRPL|nr:tetratricopeptide repeat protein 1 [Thrips palmi]XP_034255585.1 tetratricopeptide repeat protein 1 [Thrips palmi]XP_034255586.1 tetratricopeptide repeat protein 1 [Thrips palmi]